ncbi:MAG TPA: FeoA family protein [Candidatus Polarisedimenticolaceae bacterium]|nr:FeoA family protein [Candidatus Polarisedimenticolaceae bacterium]
MTQEPEEAIEPLSRLRPGEDARVVHVAARETARLVKLSTMGLVPGAVVRLVQRKPAVVLEIGHTTLALDEAITSDIFVARLGASKRPRPGSGGRP